MEKLIRECLKEHGFKEYDWEEPILVVYLKNRKKKILIYFNMMLIDHSFLSKADCVRKVLDNKLKGVSYDGT